MGETILRNRRQSEEVIIFAKDEYLEYSI
jgi:hypothetical protein